MGDGKKSRPQFNLRLRDGDLEAIAALTDRVREVKGIPTLTQADAIRLAVRETLEKYMREDMPGRPRGGAGKRGK
jgi:hypothetical protein